MRDAEESTRHRDRLAVITGTTRVYAVIGDPVDQVGSPTLLNPAFESWGADAVLVPMHIAPDRLAVALEGLDACANVDGLLVTVPHKRPALALATSTTPRARRCGGVNILRRDASGAGWFGDNVDGLGVIAALAATGVDPAGHHAVLIGAGGAGTAIAVALLDAGVAQLAVHDRVPRAAAALAERAAEPAGRLVVLPGPSVDGADLVVNATPLGTHDDDPLPLDPLAAAPGAVVVDVARPTGTTPLLRAAAESGRATCSGRAVLAHQVDHYREFFWSLPDWP